MVNSEQIIRSAIAKKLPAQDLNKKDLRQMFTCWSAGPLSAIYAKALTENTNTIVVPFYTCTSKKDRPNYWQSGLICCLIEIPVFQGTQYANATHMYKNNLLKSLRYTQLKLNSQQKHLVTHEKWESQILEPLLASDLFCHHHHIKNDYMRFIDQKMTELSKNVTKQTWVLTYTEFIKKQYAVWLQQEQLKFENLYQKLNHL